MRKQTLKWLKKYLHMIRISQFISISCGIPIYLCWSTVVEKCCPWGINFKFSKLLPPAMHCLEHCLWRHFFSQTEELFPFLFCAFFGRHHTFCCFLCSYTSLVFMLYFSCLTSCLIVTHTFSLPSQLHTEKMNRVGWGLSKCPG